jgi:hypothetical protein
VAGFSSEDREGSAGLIQQLGKFKTGKGCLYINKLDDVDMDILAQMIKNSVEFLKKKYPG